MVLEFLTLFENSSMNFRAQLSFKKKFQNRVFKSSKSSDQSSVTFWNSSAKKSLITFFAAIKIQTNIIFKNVNLK